MEDPKVDGRLQVTAALALLDRSLLVKWSASEMCFSPVHKETFGKSWRQIHPVFGRLICWMLFSAGAELLAKGACLCAGLDFRESRPTPRYPAGGLEDWSKKFLSDWKALEIVDLPYYETLGRLIYDDKNKGPALLRQLCALRGVGSADMQLLLAAYTLLAKSIRNRDAHAYVPNVRDQHLSLVPELFVACFNLLVAPLRHCSPPISEWQDSAEALVKVLRRPFSTNVDDDDDLASLCQRLKFFDEVQTLDKLTLGLNVTDAGIKSVSALANIKELHLNSSQLTNAFLENLKSLKNLESLHIYRGLITDYGLIVIAGIGTLRQLHVGGGVTRITKLGLEQFKKRRPDVQIH